MNRVTKAMHIAAPAAPRPIRLWPGVAAVSLLAFLRFVLPYLWADGAMVSVLGGVAMGIVVLIWWAFFSRAPRAERFTTAVLIILAMFATKPLLDKSIGLGMMGFMFFIYAIPVVSLFFVAAVALTRNMSSVQRRAAMAAGVVLACAVFTLLRTEGMTGSAGSDLHWRWTKSREELQLASLPVPAGPAVAPTATAAAVPAPVEEKAPASPAAAKSPEPAVAEPAAKSAPSTTPASGMKSAVSWPGFRGPGRDSAIPGTHLISDWTATPPKELWRQPIGPGWGSFAVQGDLIYTQEQRGEEEFVTCYNAITGKPVWAHQDAARFWESNAGAGPRATPTLHNGRVYTLGATGILNALDSFTGKVLWTRNAATENDAKIPGWGFSGSPLIAGDLVVIALGGQMIAYDLTTGSPRWTGPKGGGGYSSPQLVQIDGVSQVVLLSGNGFTSINPADGKVLWKHDLPDEARIVQPGFTSEGDLLLSGGGSTEGIRRVSVSHGSGAWSTQERWISNGLKPYFNDFVVHDGYAYGFDGAILSCIDLKDGKRKWKGGRYGHGQMVLLRDQALLLVLSEEGELALVKAAPDQFTELARFRAMEGKTWNHPVLVGDRLLVRNGNEMVAFRLPVDAR